MDMIWKRFENESDEELIYRVCQHKDEIGTWETIQMSIGHIQVGMQRTLPKTDATTKVRRVGIVFLVHLRPCAMVAVAQQGTCRTVLVQRSIQAPIGGKRRQVPARTNA